MECRLWTGSELCSAIPIGNIRYYSFLSTHQPQCWILFFQSKTLKKARNGVGRGGEGGRQMARFGSENSTTYKRNAELLLTPLSFFTLFATPTHSLFLFLSLALLIYINIFIIFSRIFPLFSYFFSSDLSLSLVCATPRRNGGFHTHTYTHVYT